MDRTEFFKASKPALFLDSTEKGDRAMRPTFHAETDRLVWESGKGLVSETCFGHCTVLCEEAKGGGWRG